MCVFGEGVFASVCVHVGLSGSERITYTVYASKDVKIYSASQWLRISKHDNFIG